MRVPAPFYVLPLLIAGALALDYCEEHLWPRSAAEEPRSSELASTLQMGGREEGLDEPGVSISDHELQPSSELSLDLGPASSPSGTIAIDFTLERPAYARLSIFDARGRKVRQLAAAVFNRGSHECVWDGRTAEGVPVEGGVYFARLESRAQVATLRLVRD